MPDLDKLRKFALLAALLLVSYTAAGIQLEPGAKASLFGIPFTITTPDLLQLGLVLLSIYGLLRYYYYGHMLSSSPYRKRKDLLHKLHPEGGRGTYEGSVFYGPSRFSTTPLVHKRELIEPQVVALTQAFPKIGTYRPKGEIKAVQLSDDDGELYVTYQADITIPLPCRLVALVQDIDYSAPVWANLGALIVGGLRAIS